jgi:hypothetical protein
VGEDFAAEQPHLLPLPAEPFDAARMLPSHRVDTRRASVCGSTTTRSRRGLLAGGSTCGRAPAWSRSVPVASRLPVMRVRSPRVVRPWCWTTTWRCWSESPARCLGRPRWSRPASRARSRPPRRVLDRLPAQAR